MNSQPTFTLNLTHDHIIALARALDEWFSHPKRDANEMHTGFLLMEIAEQIPNGNQLDAIREEASNE